MTWDMNIIMTYDGHLNFDCHLNLCKSLNLRLSFILTDTIRFFVIVSWKVIMDGECFKIAYPIITGVQLVSSVSNSKFEPQWSIELMYMLHKLHWLPVSSRIEFKIATLTFKVLKFQKPAYIYDMIAPYIPPRSLRSSNKNLLIVPDIRSEMSRRSFSLAAPTIWNSLPQHIRSSDSLSVFRGLLKTFLYQKSLPP